MTSLFTARRRAEEFAAAVDRGPAQPAPGDPQLRELVGVATALRAHAEAATPRHEFVTDLRARLMAEAATVLSADAGRLTLPARQRGARERRLVAAASAVVLIGGTASMAAAAQSALPGEALYPIKRGIEQAQAGLSMSPAGKGRDLLHQADDRLAEVDGLIRRDTTASTPQVPHTLQEFSRQATQGADLLLESFQDTRDPRAVDTVRTFAADGLAMLTALAADAPADTQDDLGAAALTLHDIDAQARAACGDCTDLPELQVPGIFLARAEVDRAMQQVGGSLLDNSHPVVVPRAVATQLGPRSVPTLGPTASPTAAAKPPADTSSGFPSSVPGDQPTTGTDGLGGLIGSVTDGLGGAVSTLLPDPGDVLP